MINQNVKKNPIYQFQAYKVNLKILKRDIINFTSKSKN